MIGKKKKLVIPKKKKPKKTHHTPNPKKPNTGKDGEYWREKRKSYFVLMMCEKEGPKRGCGAILGEMACSPR